MSWSQEDQASLLQPNSAPPEQNVETTINLSCGHCPVLDDPFGNYQELDRIATGKLVTAIIICFVFMVIEIIGGYISGSLAIITDATHLLSDVAGFLVSLFAVAWSRKRASFSMSYGYHRAEILGALLSISLVWAMTFYLLIEAVDRLRNPMPIDGKTMTIIALLGVLVNAVIGLVLHDHGHGHHHHDSHSHERPSVGQTTCDGVQFLPERRPQNLNVRAAFIHAIGDLIQSVGVLIAALLIWYRPDWHIADPLCTFLFSILVVASTWFLARDTILILMEGTPKNIHPQDIQRELGDIDGVTEVHDLHVWSLAPGKISATVHIVIDWSKQEADPTFYKTILTQCQKVICRHNVHHATIQMDPNQLMDFHCRVDCCGSTENFFAAPK